MTKKRIIRISLGILFLLMILVIFTNVILESIAGSYLEEKISKINTEKDYVLNVEDFGINIFLGEINIEGISIKPKAELFDSLVNGNTEERVLKELLVSKVTFSGLGILNYLTKKHLGTKEIVVDELNFNLYRPQKEHKVDVVDKEKKSSFSLDSIHLSGFKEISLNEIKIENYGFHIINASNMDTISSYKGTEFIIDGIDLVPVENSTGYFYFDNKNLEVRLKKQEFDLSGGLYVLNFENLVYTFQDEHISIDELSFKPRVSNAEVMSTFTYSSEVYEFAIKNISISGFDVDPLLHSNVLYINQIDIDSMITNIAKDKSKPFDLNKHTLLPQQSIKKLNHPLFINKIEITNSSLNYSEQMKSPKDLLNIDMTDVNISVNNVTSIHDSLNTNNDLLIDFEATLLQTVPLKTHLKMPYNSSDGQFYFSGNTLGATEFTNLNRTIFQAIGVKLQGGTLDGLNWIGKGNSSVMDGSFTLLYTDLDVELLKKDNSENKTLSWMANSIVKSSNPNKNGKTTVSKMHFERVIYKGIGNFLWKSIQSGIVNSLVPFGKHDATKTKKKVKNKPVKKNKSKNTN